MELTSSTGILKKNLFVQGSYESIKRLSKYLVSPTWLPQEFQNKNVLYESIKRLKGKTRKFLFFQGSIWQNNSVSSVCTAPHQSTVLPPQQYYTQHCTALYRATQSSQPKRAAQRVGLGWVHIHRNANRRAKPTWSWTLRETHHHCAVCTGPHHQTDIQLVSQPLWLRVSMGPPGWQVLMSLTDFGRGVLRWG